ncbi:hypothetical protein MBLNU457_g0155t2 [Dothideomycetes sp. NU457]
MSSDQEQRKQDPTAGEHQLDSSKHVEPHESRYDAEKLVKRNPHGNFKEVEASRPNWNEYEKFAFTQTKKPDWQPGDGANDNGECLKHNHVDIDPYEQDRPAVFNYKLLISAIVPRPIGFVSTTSADGKSTNLAPFSYTQVVNHDPPVFTIGYAGGFEQAKDSLKNLTATGECVINIISEHMIEAANATSINAPYGVSEWALTGLTPAKCKDVKADRVKESVFAVECKLMNTQEFESRGTPGKKTGVLAVVEGVRFWVREDAINEERNIIDPAILKPVSRLGGITYGRVVEGVEIPRPDWNEWKDKVGDLAKPKADGQ